jgi:hypothetical protein
MAVLLTRPFSTKFSEAMWAEIEAEAERLKQTSSDVVRLAITEYFNRDRKQSNLELLLYEIVKTRAVIMRAVDPDETLTADVLEWAEKDAETYLKERKANKEATL